mgnify:CR=1 FL=1
MKSIFSIFLLVIGYTVASQGSKPQPGYQETVSYIETHGERIANQNLKQFEGSISSVTFEVKNRKFLISIYQEYLNDSVLKEIKYEVDIDNIKSIGYPLLNRVMGSNENEDTDLNFYPIDLIFGIPVIAEKILRGYDDTWEKLEPANELTLIMKPTADLKDLIRLYKALSNLVELVQEHEDEESIFD